MPRTSPCPMPTTRRAIAPSSLCFAKRSEAAASGCSIRRFISAARAPVRDPWVTAPSFATIITSPIMARGCWCRCSGGFSRDGRSGTLFHLVLFALAAMAAEHVLGFADQALRLRDAPPKRFLILLDLAALLGGAAGAPVRLVVVHA